MLCRQFKVVSYLKGILNFYVVCLVGYEGKGLMKMYVCFDVQCIYFFVFDD